MLSERLKELRKEKDVTQSEVAKELGVDRSTYGKYETGDSVPDLDKLNWLAGYFKVSTDYLLGRSNIKASVEVSSKESPINEIEESLRNDPDLLTFWKDMQEREDLQLLFKQTRNMSPKGIKQVIRVIKAIEDEEDSEFE
ncbi:MAG: helix-turn-helix transcriptional regulator [Clostridiales bacterium]|jgi:transcriptional regulator with XRE-family HTH domain|nr:helix-turn-helix transcriptional regulator [Clostridiales bacterium]